MKINVYKEWARDGICPCCGDALGEYPALSRKYDVKICSDCGTREAICDFYGHEQKESDWVAFRHYVESEDPFRATIKVVLHKGNYTLIEYTKGDRQEWCVTEGYVDQWSQWDRGHYAYSLEDALLIFLQKAFRSDALKGRHQREVENKHGICFERMEEIASRAIGCVKEDEYSMECFLDDVDLEKREMEFFEIEIDGEEW